MFHVWPTLFSSFSETSVVGNAAAGWPIPLSWITTVGRFSSPLSSSQTRML
jgi:hypothetical protein